MVEQQTALEVATIKMLVKNAVLTRDTEAIGKMDPFVQGFINDKEVFKTKILDEAGQTPQWIEEVTFKYLNPKATD